MNPAARPRDPHASRGALLPAVRAAAWLLAFPLALILAAPTAWAQGAEAEPARRGMLDETQWRAELQRVERDFFDRDRSFGPEARAQARASLARLRERSGPVARSRWVLDLAQLAALADNAHTALLPLSLADAANRVPIRLVPFGADGSEFRVLRAQAPHHELLGLRLAAVDGRPLAALREGAHRLQGGPPAWRDRSAPFLFESPELLQALGLAEAADAAEYRFWREDGSSLTRRLVAQPSAPMRPRANTARLLLPEVLPEVDGWRGVLPAAEAPWSLRDATTWLRWRWQPQPSLLTVEMRVVGDAGPQRLADFFAAVRAAIAEHAPRHLVLDLRQNGGGDLTRARDFAESLPGLIPGRLFVLTSPWTFSAAIATAAYLKQAAPQRVTLVGEPVGDRLEFFAEGQVLRLPHSGGALLPATERHDYVGGCAGFDDCHAPVRLRPIRLPSLAPELPAPWTFEAYRRGIDPAMEAVLADLARG